MDRWLRVSKAATYLGVHPDTLRVWADSGRVESTRVAGERRFLQSTLDKFLGTSPGTAVDARAVAVYCRVSGGGDQKSSLAAQRVELSAGVIGDIKVYSEVGSGLSVKRRRLNALLDAVAAGEVREVRVTHSDRLARFGVDFLQRFLTAHRCELVVLHDATFKEPADELLADFMSLVASFSGRMYGMRSAAARQRLLSQAAGSLNQ